MKRTRYLLNAIPALVVMILIFYFSSQHAEESNTSSNYIVDKIVYVIHQIQEIIGHEPKVNPSVVDTISFIVRKLAHTLEYAVLGACLSYFFYPIVKRKGKRFVITVLCGGLYACTDEWHQSFVPGRSCEVRDVMIDTIGVFLGIILFSLIVKVIRIRYIKHRNEMRSIQ